MKNKEKKKYFRKLASENLEFFFSLLDSRFKPSYDKYYIREIKRISEAFNIRLDKSQKDKFCRKCNTYSSSETREIRLKKGFKEVKCKNCSNIRRFKFK